MHLRNCATADWSGIDGEENRGDTTTICNFQCCFDHGKIHRSRVLLQPLQPAQNLSRQQICSRTDDLPRLHKRRSEALKVVRQQMPEAPVGLRAVAAYRASHVYQDRPPQKQCGPGTDRHRVQYISASVARIGLLRDEVLDGIGGMGHVESSPQTKAFAAGRRATATAQPAYAIAATQSRDHPGARGNIAATAPARRIAAAST